MKTLKYIFLSLVRYENGSVVRIERDPLCGSLMLVAVQDKVQAPDLPYDEFAIL